MPASRNVETQSKVGIRCRAAPPWCGKGASWANGESSFRFFSMGSCGIDREYWGGRSVAPVRQGGVCQGLDHFLFTSLEGNRTDSPLVSIDDLRLQVSFPSSDAQRTSAEHQPLILPQCAPPRYKNEAQRWAS